MAGGEGTRLRPLTADMPKPMAPIMGRSVLEHMLRLLRRCGVDRALVTLGYMADEIERWAASQPVDGLEISCRRETEPLGTAGGVRAAADWLAGEEFLVVSGDAVCDFDLKACAGFRREKRADAVIALASTEEPGEYGSVITDDAGRILQFLEKPRADRVATDLINTGIYALSPAVLELIEPGKPCDFGRDVFPEMLRRGMSLYGLGFEGYWCDMGSIPAYLSCCRDALHGRISLETEAPLRQKGVWSFRELPRDAAIFPPVYIGRNVVIEPGAVIGPAAVLEDGSSVASGARVTNSVVMGAALRRGALVSGSWLGSGAVIGERAIVSDGCAVGSGAVAGSCSMLETGTRLWPKRDVLPGERVSGSFEDRPVRGPLHFGAGGVIGGEWNAQITPEAAFALGCAAAKWGSVGVSCSAGGAAQLVLAALECGIRAGGAAAVETDAAFEYAAAYTAQHMKLPVTVFVREKNGYITLTFYCAEGRQIGRDMERTLEAGAAGSLHIAPAEKTGELCRVRGAMEALCTEAAGRMGSGTAQILITGEGAESEAIRLAIKNSRVSITDTDAVLQLEEGGFALTGKDEAGTPFFARDAVMLALLARFERGETEPVTVPAWAPRAALTLAEKYGVTVHIEGRGDCPPPEGTIFTAAELIAALAGGDRLCDMRSRLPDYAVAECEVPVRFGAAVMRRLREQCRDMDCDTVQGLELHQGTMYAAVRPVTGALRIAAEADSMEAAQEFCFRLRDLARECDGE